MAFVRSAVVGAARFIYFFVFGDDWTVAVVILLALAATGALAANHISAWWLVPFTAIFMTGVSLRRSTRRQPTA